MTRTRSGKSVTFEDKGGEEVTSPAQPSNVTEQRELAGYQRTRKRKKGVQGALRPLIVEPVEKPIDTEPVETVGDTEQVETVVVGEQVENSGASTEIEAEPLGTSGASTSGAATRQPSGSAGAPTEVEPLGTSGATTFGAATGQPSGSAGAPTEAEAATKCLEYDSDDGVVVDTDILLGKDWKEHVGFALLKQHV